MADLSKFGIPLNGQRYSILAPKMQYRFRVTFSNFGAGTGTTILTQNIKTVTRPNLDHQEVVVDSYNSRAYYAGKHTWSDVTITLRDDITNGVVSKVGEQIQKQMNHFEQTSAVAAINYKFICEIQILDGTDNDHLEAWRLDGCFVKSVNYGQTDYATSDPIELSMVLRYDNATNISGPNTNSGTTVGGNPFPNTPSPTGGTRI